jgi:hypothetical protein
MYLATCLCELMTGCFLAYPGMHGLMFVPNIGLEDNVQIPKKCDCELMWIRSCIDK